MRPNFRSMTSRGFTLIELMIVIAIVAILAAVALPSYRDYVIRGYVVDATTLLSTYQAQMERYYQDNRKYSSVNSTTIVSPCAAGTDAQRTQGKFTLTCSGANLSDNAFTLTATGSGAVANFVYTVNNTGVRTSSFPTTATGWANCATGWITKKGQTCS